MIITFIGNCQMLTLCFYFQQLLNNNNNIYWILYGEEFKQHLYITNWSDKCLNKILDYDKSIQIIKNSDIIIYQNISLDKSFDIVFTIMSIILLPLLLLLLLPLSIVVVVVVLSIFTTICVLIPPSC